MDGRGSLTSAAVGLVLVVAGFAVADTLRGCETTRTKATPAPTTAPDTAPAPTTTAGEGPTPQPDAPADWPQGELDGVLTFVSADDCRIRSIGLAGGRERPLTRFVTDCRGFWAPKVGSRVAFGEVLSDLFFRIRDLGHPRRDYGVYPIGAQTRPFWSPDGQRLAWCDSPTSGVEREILGQGRILPFCPIAYAPDGRLARLTALGLEVDGEVLLRTRDRIDAAQIGTDGSVGVLANGGELKHYADERLTGRIDLPALWSGAPLVFSPDACRVAVPLENGIAVVGLGCAAANTLAEFPGSAASWSPDGAWLAVAEPEAIVFHEIASGAELHWPAAAVQLEWRAG